MRRRSLLILCDEENLPFFSNFEAWTMVLLSTKQIVGFLDSLMKLEKCELFRAITAVAVSASQGGHDFMFSGVLELKLLTLKCCPSFMAYNVADIPSFDQSQVTTSWSAGEGIYRLSNFFISSLEALKCISC